MSQLVYIYSLMIWELLKWVNKMKKIYCELHLFDLNQTIYVIDLETVHQAAIAVATMEELPEVISQLAHEHNIYTVKLAGSGKYSQLIEYGIETTEMKKYNENKIKIEVI